MLANAVFNQFCDPLLEAGCYEYDFNGDSSNPLIEVIIDAIKSELPPGSDEEMSVKNIDSVNEPTSPKASYPEYQIGFKNCDMLRNLIKTPFQRASELDDVIKHFKCIIPKVVAPTGQHMPTSIDVRF